MIFKYFVTFLFIQIGRETIIKTPVLLKTTIRQQKSGLLTQYDQNNHHTTKPFKKSHITSKRMLLGLQDRFYRICLAFAVKKTYFLIFFKPIIDDLNIVMLNSLDGTLGFQPPPPINS